MSSIPSPQGVPDVLDGCPFRKSSPRRSDFQVCYLVTLKIIKYVLAARLAYMAYMVLHGLELLCANFYVLNRFPTPRVNNLFTFGLKTIEMLRS